MQLYLAIAMVAALFSLREFASAYPSIRGRLSQYTEEEFVAGLDGGILSGNFSFSSYIPVGMCNATIRGSVFTTRYGKFNGISGMELSGKPFCPDRTSAILYFAYLSNGTVMVSR